MPQPLTLLSGTFHPIRDCRQRGATAALPPAGANVAMLADATGLGLDSFLPALGMKQEVAVLASALFAIVSVVVNLWGNVLTEKKRAELQLELERDRMFQAQLREVQSVIARYRGPLLESAIDLEQRIWHLITDQCADHATPSYDDAGAASGGTPADSGEDIKYFLFTMAQFLGFVEVVRRESPRERPFLQAGNPQGSDTLSTLVEGLRFVLCGSAEYLEDWYLEGSQRTHPGARRRRSREEIIERHLRQEAVAEGGCLFSPEADLLRVSRGHQRAIGTAMIITAMGAERHYTASYGEFHARLERDPDFQAWFVKMRADAEELATGAAWRGEGPFPLNRWTRALLLQQLLVELFDLLDPDCVRLPLERRVRLMPLAWGPLPRLSQYQNRLRDLANAADVGAHQAALDGLRDLWNTRGSGDDGPLVSSLRSLASYDDGGAYVPGAGQPPPSAARRGGLPATEVERLGSLPGGGGGRRQRGG